MSLLLSHLPPNSQNIGSKGPFLCMDIVHHTVSKGVPNPFPSDAPSFNSASSTALAVHSELKVMSGAGIGAGAGGDRSLAGSTVTRPHSTVAGVDSLGNVTMALIPHSSLLTPNRPGPVPFRGAYAKIPTTSNSGTFRTLMLSSRSGVQGPGSASPPSLCLALGCASVVVKVFSVTVVESPSAPPAFHLSLLYKANTGFMPAYLLSLPLLPWNGGVDGGRGGGEESVHGRDRERQRQREKQKERERDDPVHWTPDILAVSAEGDMAYLYAHTAQHSPAPLPLPLFAAQSISTNTKERNPPVPTPHLQTQTVEPECVTIRSGMSPLGPSPPLLGQQDTYAYSDPVGMATCSEARLTATLHRGKLQLMHSDSGIQVIPYIPCIPYTEHCMPSQSSIRPP